MTTFRLVAMLALGGVLLVGPSLTAAADCCSVVSFDAKTRLVTVRDAASGATYQCTVPASQEASLLKAGVKVDLDVAALARAKAGGGSSSTGQAATSSSTTSSCGGWNGPRTGTTKPPGQPPPKPR
jgi:hypothetical protein